MAGMVSFLAALCYIYI